MRFSTAKGVAAVALALTGTFGAPSVGKELNKADRRWLEQEVAVLITDEERELFQDLDSDADRATFKRIFWARRDPTPTSPRNERKEAFEARWKVADRRFRTFGRSGAATDMGRVFLLMGAPSEVRTATSGEGDLCFEGLETDVEKAVEETMHIQSRSMSAEEADSSEASTVQTWVYGPNEDLGIPNGTALVFRMRPGLGYLAIHPGEMEQILERVRRSYIVSPHMPYSRDGRGRLRDLETVPGALGRRLWTLRNTLSASSEVTFRAEPAFFRAGDGSVYVPILWIIDGGSLRWSGDRSAATIGGIIEDARGELVSAFEEETELIRDSMGRAGFEMPLWLAPGAYTAYLGVRDDRSGRTGTEVRHLQVPALTGRKLELSSVVLFSDGQRTAAPRGAPGKAFILGGYHFVPRLDRVYHRSERLSGVFHAYGYAMDRDAADLTVQYVFSRNGETCGRTREAPFLSANEEAAITVFDIPLSTFEPGNYTLSIQVRDHTSGAMVTRDLGFTLHEASRREWESAKNSSGTVG